VTGIDWNAADSPEVPAEASFLRTSGSCHELIHWLIDSSGKIRQLEKAGLRVSDVRNISAFLLFRASVLSCGRF
jgi:hypothetical protein